MGFWDDVKRQAKQVLDESGIGDEASRLLKENVDRASVAKDRWRALSAEGQATWRCGPCGYAANIPTQTKVCPTCGASSSEGNVNRAQWRRIEQLRRDSQKAGLALGDYLLHHWFGYPDFVTGLTTEQVTRRAAVAYYLDYSYGRSDIVFRDGRFGPTWTQADIAAERGYLSGERMNEVGPEWVLNRDPYVPLHPDVAAEMQLAEALHAAVRGEEPDDRLIAATNYALRSLDRWTPRLTLRSRRDALETAARQWQDDMGPFVLLSMFGRDQSLHALTGRDGPAPLSRWLAKLQKREDAEAMKAAILFTAGNWFGAAKTMLDSEDASWAYVTMWRTLTKHLAHRRLLAEQARLKELIVAGTVNAEGANGIRQRLRFTELALERIKNDNPYTEAAR